MAPDKKQLKVTVAERRGSEDAADTEAPVVKTARAFRFGEATSVDSPVEASTSNKVAASFDSLEGFHPQPQPGDIGFGYINDRRSAHGIAPVEMPISPKSPLKSAMKLPGAAPRNFDNALKSPTFADGVKSPTFGDGILSPTWKEEKLLEKRETMNDKRQQDDLKIKLRVRMAKMVLRFTNFSCSLIVLAMLSTVLTIFYATVSLPARNTLPAWAPNTPQWPQITMLVIACISLVMSIVILIAYFRGGHRKAEKYTVYASVLAVSFFVVSIVMWGVGAGLLQKQKNEGQGKDMWGWSCKKNNREIVFGDNVPYALICRLQNWSLVCAIIEIVVEVITIMVYAIVFYRFWSKRKLRRTMAARDKARSELYMSQMRSGANTPAWPMSPGIPNAPLSPRDGGYNPMFSPRFAPGNNLDAAEKGQADVEQAGQLTTAGSSKPFTLQKPPMKSPKTNQSGRFETVTAQPAAPGEQQYGEVPIPQAYASPVASPTVAGGFPALR